jgi:hypothetical protein
VAKADDNERQRRKRRSKKIKTPKSAGSARSAENPMRKGSSVLSEKTWIEENGY